MAKLPKVIRDINRRGFADGGSTETALAYATTPPEQKTTLQTGEQPAVASLTEQPGEILSGTDVQLGADPTMTTAQASTTGIEIPSSNAQVAAQYSNYFVNQNTPEAIAAQGNLSQEAILGDVLGTVSTEAKAQAAQGTVSEKATLNSRLQSAVNNAKSFLSMDMANLDANQKTNILNAQAKIQTLLSDQSQENASRQFNAKSNQQTMEFFSELGVQIDNANATRVSAMRQFNASEENSVLKFKSQMEDSRDKFNSNMSAQINQANANWRRQINTENTARQNEVNRINAQALLGLSTSSQEQLWQRYRDEASFLVQVVENAADRAHSMAEISQQAGYDKAMYDSQFKNTMYAQLGSSTLDGIFDIVSNVAGIVPPTPDATK